MGTTRTTQRTLVGAALVATAMILVSLPVRAQQLPSDEAVFVRASVDNDQPYLGQQITYVIRIYQRSDSSYSLHYEPPGFAGFWDVHATEQEEYSETIDSTEYRVIELRTLLFPSVVETIEIEAGVVSVSASALDGPIVVESVPVVVEVRPTPSNAPAGFAGAVGNFEISADVDTTNARMNDSVKLTVTVKGAGNIGVLPAPSWPEFQGWRVVESPAVSSSEVVDGKLVGSRTYESVLVPELAGELTVPEIVYAYYDPDLEEYVQATTSPIVVTIVGVDGARSLPTSSAEGNEGEPTVTGAKSIRAVPPVLHRSGADVTGSVLYWVMWGLPLLVIAGAVVWRRRRDAWESALLDSRRRNALPNAQSTLERSTAAGDDHGIAAADAVLSYVSDRFGESLTGLTREALVQRLKNAGATSDLIQRVEATLALGEAARYTPEAPYGGPPRDRIESATRLLIELDGAIEP